MVRAGCWPLLFMYTPRQIILQCLIIVLSRSYTAVRQDLKGIDSLSRCNVYCAVVQGEEGVAADPASPTGHPGGPMEACGGL